MPQTSSRRGLLSVAAGSDDPFAVGEVVGNAGDDRAESIGEHVLLRIPDIALGAEELGAAGGIGGDGIEPFDDFKNARHRQNQGHGEPDAEPAVGAEPAAFDKLENGIGIQAHGEVADPVEMIPLRPDQIRDPAKGNLGEGVVPADGVQENQYRHQQVGGVGEANPLEIHPDQRNHNQQDGDILRDPGRPRDRMNRQDGEFNDIKREQKDGELDFHDEGKIAD